MKCICIACMVTQNQKYIYLRFKYIRVNTKKVNDIRLSFYILERIYVFFR